MSADPDENETVTITKNEEDNLYSILQFVYPHVTVRFDRRYFDNAPTKEEEERRIQEMYTFFDRHGLPGSTGSLVWCENSDPHVFYANVPAVKVHRLIKRTILKNRMYRNCIKIRFSFYRDSELLDYLWGDGQSKSVKQVTNQLI